MAKNQAAKINIKEAAKGQGGIGSVYIPESKPAALSGVYRTHRGLYKMEQPHTQRLNMVMPPQLMEAFERITEKEHGPRSKSAVMEHLIISYCKENGVNIEE